MTTKVKLQHYVSQFYLMNFVIKPKKRLIFCFDKSNSKSFAVSLKGVASESYFYDKPDEEEQKVEKALGIIESSFKPVLDKIVAGDLGILTDEDQELFAVFIMAQEFRTREFRETVRDIWTQGKERLYQYKLTDEFKKQYCVETWDTEESAKILQLTMLRDIVSYAEILLQMKWILFANRTPMPFWTSDHPITRYNSIDTKPLGNLGLLCKGIEIHFPLSPKIVLCITDPELNIKLPSRIEVKDIQCVNFENSLQMSHCTKYIFSNISDFSLANQILRKYPSPGRKRIEVH